MRYKTEYQFSNLLLKYNCYRAGILKFSQCIFFSIGKFSHDYNQKVLLNKPGNRPKGVSLVDFMAIAIWLG